MYDPQRALQVAYDHHQAGRFVEAEQAYRQILERDPQSWQALHLLGVLAMQCGRAEAAVGLIDEAARLAGPNAAVQTNLGEAWRAAGNLDKAVECYQRAVQLDPRLAQAHFFLGLAHQARGALQAAGGSLQQAVAVEPQFADAWYALGNTQRMAGEGSAAIESYQRALAVHPDHVEALLNLGSLSREHGRTDEARHYLRRAITLQPQLGEAHFFLGNLESACENWELAATCYESAVRLEPARAEAHARLGSVRQVQGDIDSAMAHYRRALALCPRLAEAHYNLGTALAAIGRMEEAVEEYEACLRDDPHFLGAHVNLAAYHQERGAEEQALEHIRRGMEIDPLAPEPHFNLALSLLAKGELEPGWKEFENRLRLPNFPVRVRREPQWDGGPLSGKTLLVHVEQGLGDTLQFIRLVPLAQERGARLILQVQDPLVPLLGRCGFGPLYGLDNELPPYDVQIPIMSLPGALGITLANIPQRVPYLSVGDELVAAWRERLAHIQGFRVGIVWQGSKTHVSDAVRSIQLTQFAPLAAIADVRLISLQKRDGLEQLASAGFDVQTIDGPWDDESGAFVDTAAIVQNLDLVVAADTAVAHLAGALGVPTWVALTVRCDWRWMRDREDTPWYPTLRLFRQTRERDWSEVFARMAAELSRRAGPA